MKRVIPKLPPRVKVGWRTYDIVELLETESHQERRYGDTRHLMNMIRVQTKGCDSRQTAHTLLHEIMHAICYIFGIADEDKEERVVSAMSDGMTTVWRDNPEVMAYIHHHLLNPVSAEQRT